MLREFANTFQISFLVVVFVWSAMLGLGWIERDQILLSLLLALIAVPVLHVVAQAMRAQL